MDIYDYLKMDHEKVAHLFKLFEKSKILKRKQEIVSRITTELLVHAHAEQEILYKKLLQFHESAEDVLHGEKEHKEIEEQIKKINSAKGASWEKAVLKLKDLVEHHVKEEEHEMFKQAKKVLSKDDALILKEKVHYLKGSFLLWLDKESKKAS